MLSVVVDDGNAIHYAAVERGTPVYDSEGVEVGKVAQVVDNKVCAIDDTWSGLRIVHRVENRGR